MEGRGRPGCEGREFDRRRLDTGVVVVGTFRLAPDHPSFEDTGPIREPLFVFPRTSCVIEHEGEPPFVTDTTVVTYYNRGQRYARRPVDPRGDLCDWYSLREDVLREMLERWDPTVADRPGPSLIPFNHGPSDPGSYLLQRQVLRHVLEVGEPDRLTVEETILTVLERILALRPWAGTRTPSGSTAGGADAVAEAVRKVLLSSFHRSLSLAEIADETGISVYHMCRQFRRSTGATIHRYRHQLRLRRSLEWVADSAEDLSAVAHRLGYSSHSHFTDTFHRVFGITPSAFRSQASSRAIRELARGLPSPC